MNLFNLCVFGKLVEETEGAFGTIFTYVICALGESPPVGISHPTRPIGRLDGRRG
jgi:hypothetical protein